MIETNPSSNAATVSIYLLRSFIVSNVRDSLVYIFGGLKLCYYVLSFPPFHPIIRPSVSQSVCRALWRQRSVKCMIKYVTSDVDLDLNDGQ